jgi:signal transduction histidine kinase/ActR/RegA family two-component response regulator
MLTSRLFNRVRRTRLAVKLAWFTAGLAALIVGIAIVVLSAQIRVSTRSRFADELRRNQSSFVQLQRHKLDELTTGASLISRTASLPYALETIRAEALMGTRRPDLATTVQRELERLVRDSGKDMLLVTDEKGLVFASAALRGKPVPPGTNLSAMRAVIRALDPGASSDSASLAVLHQPAGDYQVAVFPIENSGYTLGTLMLGERLESGFAASARASFDGHVIVTEDRKVVSGAVPGLSGDALGELLGYADIGGPTTLSLDGEELVVAPVELGETQDRSRVELWLLQPLTQTVRQLTRPLIANFLLYGFLAVICAGIGAALIARSVLRPLDRFVGYLRKGTTRERLGTRFDAGYAPPEVRTLSDSFSTLMESLDVEQRELQVRTVELASALDGLKAQIAERERVEVALRESEAQLRQSQKLEAIGTLAGGVAHDFNNLLTVISGFTQMAIADLPTDSQASGDLAQVLGAAESAEGLTRQLLAFSRKQVLQPTALDLTEVVDGVAPMLRRLIGAHIELRVEHDPRHTRIFADRGQLEQVIINLAVNARDAMPRGGTITLRTGQANTATRTEPDSRAATAVMLSVADTGTGIPDSVRERIFEPFFTTKEAGKGTGLGLSTVYGIVKQTGGTIDFTSAAGKGTTFTVSLPAVSEVAASRKAEVVPAVERGTETVLLVEDNTRVRALARRALESFGYTVLAANGAQEALALVAAQDVDALLTDVVMPEFSGPQLAERLRSRYPKLPVVFMSGYADEALRTFDVRAGTSFIKKPFTPPQLAHAVRTSIDEQDTCDPVE